MYAMIRYKFESNSQRVIDSGNLKQNVYAMIRYKFESNSQHEREAGFVDAECVCYD